MIRLVQERVATLDEIRRSWSIDDVFDHNDALDAIADANAEAAAEAKRGR